MNEASAPILEVQDLSVSYGAIKALKGVSIRLMPDEIVTLIGANGAGKSTTLRAILGLVTPSGGEIRFRGEPTRAVATFKLVRRGLILVPEGRAVFANLSVRENLEMGAYARRDRQVDSDFERVFRIFPRLKERISQTAGTLSGGEQQMLAIGRALMARPRLLLLDEPSLGLSPVLTREIFSIITRINTETGTTILVVEQNAAIALATAHQGYVMERGRVVAAGTCAELMQKQDVQEFYLGGGSRNEDGRVHRWKRRKTWR